MSNRPSRHYPLARHNGSYPPPVIITEGNDGYPYPPPYPVPAYPPPYPVPAYPPSPYGPPPARSGASRRLAIVLLLAALVGGGLWLASKQQAPPPPVTSRPAPPPGSFLDFLPPRDDPPPWFQGQWVPENGADVPRLELKGYGSAVTGELGQAWTGGGYVMSLPLLAGEANKASVLFSVEGRPPQHVTQFYFLEWQGAATAALYHLKPPPPGRPYTANLIPRDLPQHHTLLATLVRANAAGTLRLDPAAAPPDAKTRAAEAAREEGAVTTETSGKRGEGVDDGQPRRHTGGR